MDKKVLIISSSPRKGGNSETLAAAFAKGAREAGNQVETVYLREKQVGFCKGCLACLKLGHCVIQDDAVEIAAQMHDADVLVRNTRLLLLRQRSAQDYAGSCQPIVRYGLCLYESLSACNGGRERIGDLCGHRESRAGLGGLLPSLCAGWHSVCRRRKRRG